MNPALRPNLINQNNGVPSDPINALQTLAVTAGQPNQMNIQQNNYRKKYLYISFILIKNSNYNFNNETKFSYYKAKCVWLFV